MRVKFLMDVRGTDGWFAAEKNVDIDILPPQGITAFVCSVFGIEATVGRASIMFNPIEYWIHLEIDYAACAIEGHPRPIKELGEKCKEVKKTLRNEGWELGKTHHDDNYQNKLNGTAPSRSRPST